MYSFVFAIVLVFSLPVFMCALQSSCLFVCLFALVCIKVLPESYVSLVVMYVQRGPPRAENSPLTHTTDRTHRIYLCTCKFVGQNACLIVIVIVIVFCCCLTTSL